MFKKVLKLFCICFEADYASCVLAVVPSTSGSTGGSCPFTWKGTSLGMWLLHLVQSRYIWVGRSRGEMWRAHPVLSDTQVWDKMTINASNYTTNAAPLGCDPSWWFANPKPWGCLALISFAVVCQGRQETRIVFLPGILTVSVPLKLLCIWEMTF